MARYTALAFPLLATLLTSVSALPSQLFSRNDNPEAVTLANCLDTATSTLTSSQVGYYKTFHDGDAPTDFVDATSVPGKFHTWEGGSNQQVEFKKSGVTFSWQIDQICPLPGGFAGTANNGVSSGFKCYKSSDSGNPYTTSDGRKCSIVYICDHSTPITADFCSRPSLTYHTDANADFIQLPDNWGLSAPDMLSRVFAQFDNETSTDVNEAEIDLGENVKISFSGHGAVPGKTLHAAALLMVNTMGQSSDIMQTTHNTNQACVDSTSCCDSGAGRSLLGSLTERRVGQPCTRCCRFGDVTTTTIKMVSTATVHVDNQRIDENGNQQAEGGSLQGSLTYKLIYNLPSLDCGAWGKFKAGLGVASLVPEAEAIIGPIEVGAELIAALLDC